MSDASTPETVIRTTGLVKTFGATRALDGVDLEVPAGSVLGLLGHNGAGKTTLIHVLATLTPPTAGTAEVAGYDVVRQPVEVRRRIGVTGQFATVDEQLTGTANLVLVARLLGASARQARSRAGQLIEVFGLTGAAGRAVRTYSGGMRRRLDLAIALIARPALLFLDEPTTGLDPVSRMALWDMVRDLVVEGTSVLLTTQYLDEADRLADRIVVLESGRTVASGTAADLKATTGRRSIHVTLAGETPTAPVLEGLRRGGFEPALDASGRMVIVPADGFADLAAIVGVLTVEGVAVSRLDLTEPTLDDVYLALTRPAATGDAVPTGRR
ncbi:ATP-binding cassette domain-containing protein [Micromonospora sp. CNB394]|uniref:ATP-binding cassette domain-containing protein n=1 Tax=Micromonospora sp. CNB394 TaxID=1169151 RepID=UPI00037CAE87|nr:ATP-binding cassette domain-containing protein [Micromonospora sp. CNB394]